MWWHGGRDDADLCAVQCVEHGLSQHQVPFVDGVKGAAKNAYEFHLNDSLVATWGCAVRSNSLYLFVLSRLLRSVLLALHPK